MRIDLLGRDNARIRLDRGRLSLVWVEEALLRGGLMDYEHKIKLLEEEMRHEQELAKLRGQRLDAHDASFNSIREILKETARMQQQFAVDIARLESGLAKLEGDI